jgi:REP element-mobilizing transposase RayT
LKLKILLNNQRKRYFGKFDKLLDNPASGPLWLKNAPIAQVVLDAIKFRDGEKYELHAYCIMPNHVHMLFTITRTADSSSPNGVRTYIVSKILQDLKKFTASEANRILKRTGQFWHRESYDHVVRNHKEFNNILNYILQNPVRAGLVNDWTKWKWSYWKT